MTFGPISLFAAAFLGQSESIAPWEGVQKAFRNTLPTEQGELSMWAAAGWFVAVLLVVVLALYAVARLAQWGRKEDERRSPLRLFGYVLKQLGVGWRDRLLMRMAARQIGLPHPAVMLFTPELWQKYAGRWADQVSFPPLRAHARDRARAVMEKAFAPAQIPNA